MSILHTFKDHFFGFKMTSKPWSCLSFWQSYERLCPHFGNCDLEKSTSKIYLFARMVWNANSITTRV